MTFAALSIILFSVGAHLSSQTGKVIEITKRYDDIDSCAAINNDDFVNSCSVDIKVDSDIGGPVYVYYELKNFYQNHRTYVKSRDTGQLRGEYITDLDSLIDCNPIVSVADLYPHQ